MTPSEQWILGLFAVYSIPAFLFGVGLTLACVRWRGRRSALMPGLLSAERTFERRDDPGVTPKDVHRALLRNAVRLG